MQGIKNTEFYAKKIILKMFFKKVKAICNFPFLVLNVLGYNFFCVNIFSTFSLDFKSAWNSAFLCALPDIS